VRAVVLQCAPCRRRRRRIDVYTCAHLPRFFRTRAATTLHTSRSMRRCVAYVQGVAVAWLMTVGRRV
jgi:hypothetical protein